VTGHMEAEVMFYHEKSWKCSQNLTYLWFTLTIISEAE
jgi:hypothetical protein